MSEQILKIKMFGEFSMTYGSNTVNDKSNRSKKIWTLLEYLIVFRNKEISQADIIELLWPGEEADNPANALKTLLFRVRSVLGDLQFSSGKNIIIYRRGTYAWNNALPVLVDTEEFERLTALAASSEDKQKKLDYLLSALNLYKGDFLPGASDEFWAVPICTYFHAKYIRHVHETIALLTDMSKFDDIITLCRSAILIEPYDEQVHCSLMRALMAVGAQQNALQHYEYVTDLFFSQFGITPSDQLTALYKEIAKACNATELDLNIIKDNLREYSLRPGAFFCEYEVFKDIYRLEARVAVRTGQATYICLVTAADPFGKTLATKTINVSMDRLKDIIAFSLRRGDVFTRYSVTQFLIMLQSASYEKSDMVIKRIHRNYKKAYPKSKVDLHFKLLPLDAVFNIDSDSNLS
ncbi:MAG: SARP family transcriptional regulator [Clostridiales bacterium]|nr:SARP family transcriptional regulator [Clostridiales bacterium]